MGASANREELKVLGLLGDKQQVGAVEIYRITLPYTYINNQNSGMRCGWMTVAQAADSLRASQLDVVFNYDVIVLHRPISEMPDAGEELIQALRVQGARVVCEYEDDYSGRYRPADDTLGRTWKPYIPYVDAVTVTGRYLAQLAAEESGGKPAYVVPNAIDRQWFGDVAQNAKRLYPDHLTVMLAGTRSHRQDWLVLQEVIPDILADYPHVKFLVVGEQVYYDYLWDTGVEFLPPASYLVYPALLAQADILCAPLVPDDQFNHSKSPVKAIEGWCAARKVGKTRMGGCAMIATNCVAYRGTVQHRHNGLLVHHTPEAWREGISRLIEDQYLRQTLQVAGLKSARRYDMATRWRDWYKIYTDIAGGAI